MTLNFAKVQGLDWQDQLNQNFETIENATLIELASDQETIDGTEDTKAVTPAGLQAKLDDEGYPKLSTEGEALTMTGEDEAVSPAGLGHVFDNLDLLSFSGKNGAGACTLTGVKVGDRILSVTGVVAADVGSKGTLFETVITVEDEIQQSSASDLSTKIFLALILRAHVEEQV